MNKERYLGKEPDSFLYYIPVTIYIRVPLFLLRRMRWGWPRLRIPRAESESRDT